MLNGTLSLESFSFNKAEIKLLTSITYWALLHEAENSTSYSRFHKFLKKDDEAREATEKYQVRKRRWINDWKLMTCRLLEIDDVYIKSEISPAVTILELTGAKRQTLIVELAVFEPYFKLPKGSKGDDLKYDDEDRQRYFQFCAKILGNHALLDQAWARFNDCAKKIAKSNVGTNWTWIWAGLGAVVLLITAPYLAGAIGGIMGLSGAAATSAGLAFLGGGSLAAGGLGMTGGYFALMAGGGIFGYTNGNTDFKKKVRESNKEELLVACSKLYAVICISKVNWKSKEEVCQKVLNMQKDFEEEGDHCFLMGSTIEGQKLDNKAMVLRSFRRVVRGDL